MLDPKKFFEPRSGKRNFWPSRDVESMILWKIFKIKGPRLAKNAFREISTGKTR